MGDSGSGSYIFTWKINNFSKLIVRKLDSEVFIAGRCKWSLLIFPRGNNSDSLSIYVQVADSSSLPNGWSRNASFSLAVINQFNDKNTVIKATQHVFNAKESDWGFTSFIPLSKLKDPSAKYLPNDTLTIEAEVEVISAVHYSVAEPEKKDNGNKDQQMQPNKGNQVPSAHKEPQNQTPNVPKSVVENAQVKSLPEDRPSVHEKSKNLLTKIASRTSTTQKSSSPSNEIPSPPAKNVHQQKEALQGFFNMSLEAIQQANAFGNIEGIIVAIAQQVDSLQEKTILEDLASRLSEFRETTQNSTSIVESAQSHRTSLAGKTKDINSKLEQRQKELSSLESKFSKLSEDEAKLQAEIQRLITQKEELLSQKKSVAIELEKANQEASKDLEEWGSLEGEIKLANADWLKAKEKLALANVRWKLFKEDLGLGKLIIS